MIKYAATPAQNKPGSISNEEVFNSQQIYKIEASPTFGVYFHTRISEHSDFNPIQGILSYQDIRI